MKPTPLPHDWIVHGHMFAADFDEKTLTFRVEGDMPMVARGRFAIIPADRMYSIIRRLAAYEAKDKADGR